MRKLNIPEDVEASTKVRKLAAAVHASKEEVGRVTFDFQMKIAELQLKLQLKNPPKVWDQHRVAIKEGMTTLDIVVNDYSSMFDATMELWMKLYEDPNLQKLNMDVEETQ